MWSYRKTGLCCGRSGKTDDDLSEVIQNEFGMTKRHADFLARQETKLIKSKIIKDRAINTGHTRYVWQTAGDQRVRDTHRVLNGKIFDFNYPINDESYRNVFGIGFDSGGHNTYNYDRGVGRTIRPVLSSEK